MTELVLTIDNLGEANALQRGEWDPATPLGRHPSVTEVLPRLLDALDRHRLRATFCVEAINCELNPEAVREIAGRGHELAAHGWLHEPWAELEAGREPELLGRARAAFAALGIAVCGFRPPGGGLTARDPAALAEAGFRWCSPAREAVGGDGDGVRWVPFDWPDVDAYHLMERFAELRVRHGDPRPAATPADAAARLRRALEDPQRRHTLVLHPFLMLDPEWFGEVQSLLASLAAGRDAGRLIPTTAGAAAG
jgi:peptidoglycan-N-acetylglucosamine deacetylase